MEKKNDKIKIIIAAIILIIAVAVMIIINIFPNKNDDKLILPSDEIQLADTMLICNTDKISLINMDGTEFDSVEGNIHYAVNNGEFLYENNGTFYSIETSKNINEDESVSYSLLSNEIATTKESVSKFTFNENNIAILSETTYQESEQKEASEKETSSLTEKLPIEGEHSAYNITFIDRVTKQIEKLENVFIDNCILVKNNFIYSVGQYLYSYDLNTQKTTELYLGKTVSDLCNIDDSIVIFDEFGNQEGLSLILKTDESLNVKKATKHESVNISPINMIDTNNNIIFIEEEENPTFYLLNVDEEREVKKKNKLNITLKDFNQENSIYSKGYIYTAKDGVNVIDLKSSTLYKTLDIDAEFIYPMYDTIEEEPTK